VLPRVTHVVMAGLDPAIHDLVTKQQDVDARVKPGHDEFANGGDYRFAVSAPAVQEISSV